jgi:hypothetical protein
MGVCVRGRGLLARDPIVPGPMIVSCPGRGGRAQQLTPDGHGRPAGEDGCDEEADDVQVPAGHALSI